MIVDPVGGSQFDASLKCAAWGARIVPLGFASGKIPRIPANITLVKNLTVHGVYWGSYMTRDPATLRESMQQLIDWWIQGKFRVHVSHRWVTSVTANLLPVALFAGSIIGSKFLLKWFSCWQHSVIATHVLHAHNPVMDVSQCVVPNGASNPAVQRQFMCISVYTMHTHSTARCFCYGCLVTGVPRIW